VWTLSDAYNPIRVYRFELETNTLTGDVGYATFVNVYGIAWGPNPYGTNEVAVLAGGINGAQILLFDPADSSGTRLTAVPNVRTSNLSTIVRRPGANEYFLCDFVANLIRFDGALTSIRASNWSSCNAISMREDGSRALFVGRPTGVPLVGRVALYDGVTGSFTPSDITDVSIPGFSEAPYYGDSNAHLRAAAWRPGHCEGLIVANKGFGTNPYGMLIRFEAPGP
jgi:hypothetical protein